MSEDVITRFQVVPILESPVQCSYCLRLTRQVYLDTDEKNAHVCPQCYTYFDVLYLA